MHSKAEIHSSGEALRYPEDECMKCDWSEEDAQRYRLQQERQAQELESWKQRIMTAPNDPWPGRPD